MSTYHGGIYLAGTTNTIKFYHKGSEFAKHDYKKIHKYLSREIDLNLGSSNTVNLFAKLSKNKEVLKNSQSILRVEIEIKKKHLDSLFGIDGIIQVKNIDDELCQMYFDSEINKLLQEKGSDEMIYRNSNDVKNRLFDVYGQSLANILLGTWHNLSIHGEDYTKDLLDRRTFYRHKKQISEAQCSWISTDVVLKQYRPNFDFKPLSNSEYCLRSVAKEITNKLKVA
jgi:II/X family phage/plasmid replication protein